MGFFSAYNDARTAMQTNESDALTRRRTAIDDEKNKLARFREAETHANAQKNLDLPTAQGNISYIEDAPTQATGQPTGGGAAYVPRRGAPAPDKSIEISEASKRLSSMKNAKPTTTGLNRDTHPLGNAFLSEFDIRQQHAAAQATPKTTGGAQAVPQTAIDSMQSRLQSLQSEEAARQRGKEAPTTGGTSQYDKPTQFDAVINQAAQQNGLDPRILKRLLGTESSFNPTAVSPRGASYGLGIAQIAASHGLSDQQRLDPNTAIPFAAQLYSRYLRESGGNHEVALQRYKGASSDQGKAAMAGPISQILGGMANAVIPSAQAQPAAQTAPLNYGPNQVAGQNLVIQQQIEYLKSQLPVAKDAATAGQIRGQIQSLQLGALVNQAGADEGALGQLAAISGVQIARTPQGYVMVANDPRTGQRQPMGQPVPAAAMAQQLRLQVDPVFRAQYQEHMMQVSETNAKNYAQMERELAVARQNGENQRVQALEQGMNQLRLEMMKQSQPQIQFDRSGTYGPVVIQNGSITPYNSGPTPGFKGVTAQ